MSFQGLRIGRRGSGSLAPEVAPGVIVALPPGMDYQVFTPAPAETTADTASGCAYCGGLLPFARRRCDGCGAPVTATAARVQ